MTSDFLRLAKVKRFAAVAALVVVGVAASGLTATKAKADEYWHHHHGYYRYHDYYGPRVYVAPPPYYYAPPPRPVYVPPPPVYYAPRRPRRSITRRPA
ncbi:hypothetical protein UCD39_23645 [Nitrospirillum sp. BR 11752]|uniref:hypothetical protein n=1 Tax=Nitrospirillum sp. BR 11752 TaxID=3104293 RepID=UPI002EA107BC|nr:hypothetical protein [Nitrospirillum sp. BR 11752]